MSYDLNTCNNLPPSSSSSCSGIFYPGNTSSCRCSSCCQCRGHSCPDNLLSDHTYTLLKKICRKILRDYTRQQRRDSYTLFEGGNSVNVRVHRRASSDRRQKMRIPDINEYRRHRRRCGRDEDYDEDESRRRDDQDNNVFNYDDLNGRTDYQRQRKTQSVDQQGRPKRVQSEPQKDRVLKVGNVKESETKKRGSIDRQVKGDGKDQDDRRKQTGRGNKGKKDNSEQAESPLKNGTQKEREKKGKDDNSKQPDSSSKSNDPLKGGGKKGKNDVVEQGEKEKKGTKGKKDGSEQAEGPQKSNDNQKDREKQTKDNNKDTKEGNRGKQTKDDANKKKEDGHGKQGKGDDNDANKTKGGKEGKEDSVSTNKTKDSNKAKGGKQGNDASVDANKTKNDNNDANKTKGGKQGKDDNSNMTSKKKQDELQKDLKDKNKSDNSNKNNEKPDKGNDAGAGGNKQNNTGGNKQTKTENTKKPPIKTTTTEVNKPDRKGNVSSDDDNNKSSKQGHSKGKKEDGNKSRGNIPIVNNLREKVRNGQNAVPSPKNKNQSRVQSHKANRTSIQNSNKSAKTLNRDHRKFRPNSQGDYTKFTKDRVNIQSRQSRASQGLVCSNENNQRLGRSRCTRPSRWDQAKPHDFLRASMEQRDCMRRCQVSCEPCTPPVCNFSPCGCVNTCNATNRCGY